MALQKFFSSLLRKDSTRRALLLLLVSALSVSGYLLASAMLYRVGFPLDDSWIHQTYARNLALRGEWAFLPGKPSGGSTSPLWTAILAGGYLLHLAPYVWTFALGILLLWGLSLLAENAARHTPTYRKTKFPWIGLFFALEWHFVWAAASGMETLLFSALVAATLFGLVPKKRNFAALGALAGISVWVRPDGITLLGPVLFVLFLEAKPLRDRLRAAGSVLLGAGIFFALYLLFNLLLTGEPFPNTFYAKQIEYAALQAIPLWKRFFREFLPLLTGAGIILLPGWVFSFARAIRQKDVPTIAAALWLLGYLGIYAWRLPVLYQHGRYQIPALAPFLWWGMDGWRYFSLRRRLNGTWRFAGSMLLAGVALTFWGVGAEAYAKDVAFVESEMVTTARWISSNLPPDALIAAHDIGALGYFGNHEILDMAGLISPEAIPFLRDESRLAAYLDEKQVAYVMSFPSWYVSLLDDSSLLYQAEGMFPQKPGENMAVYSWRR